MQKNGWQWKISSQFSVRMKKTIELFIQVQNSWQFMSVHKILALWYGDKVSRNSERLWLVCHCIWFQRLNLNVFCLSICNFHICLQFCSKFFLTSSLRWYRCLFCQRFPYFRTNENSLLTKTFCLCFDNYIALPIQRISSFYCNKFLNFHLLFFPFLVFCEKKEEKNKLTNKNKTKKCLPERKMANHIGIKMNAVKVFCTKQ